MSESPCPYPPAPEQRRTGRVRCDVPVCVVSPPGWPATKTLDLSRTGARLALQLPTPACEEEASLGVLAELMKDHLAVKIVAELGACGENSAVTRALQVVRLGSNGEAPGRLELGCVFVPPLAEEDALVLGVPLPREGEPPDVARRRMVQACGDMDERARGALGRVPRPRHGWKTPPRFRVQVSPRGARKERTLLGRPLELSERGGVLCLAHACEARRVADRVIEFSRAYGSMVDVAIEEGTVFLWYGPVQVESVGVIPEVPDHLLVEFRFPRPLQSWEREALGEP
ncbi:MAG: PilZ domain-containing protein [Planctomycetota bacterium]